MEVKREVELTKVIFKKSSFVIKRGIVLIFDECTSGFESYGGLHKLYGVNPDIAILEKQEMVSIQPLWKKEIMRSAQNSFISSTFFTERIGPAAALETLEIMKKEKSWEQITNFGRQIKNSWKQLADTHNIKLNIAGIDALPFFTFHNIKNNLSYKTLIAQEMLKENYLSTNLVYVSILHNKNRIQK